MTTHPNQRIEIHVYMCIYIYISNDTEYKYIYVYYLYISIHIYLALAISSPRMGCLTMTFTGKFVYLSHHFNLLQLYRCDLRVDREGWWFENSVSQSRVCLSAEGTKNVSWHWLSPLGGWDSLTMAFTGKSIW